MSSSSRSLASASIASPARIAAPTPKTVHAVGRREEGYLLPYDADPDDVVTRGIAMSDLASWIDGLDARVVVVCLDCCHAGKVLGQRDPTPAPAARNMELRPALLQRMSGQGRYLIASCDDDQVSLEAETWGHGLFTYHLLDGIRGAGDRDGDGRIGVAELFEHVAEAVDRDARAMGTIQKPWSCAIGAGGAYLSAPRRKGDEGRPKSARALAVVAAERLWREQGPAAAVREIEHPERAIDDCQAGTDQREQGAKCQSVEKL